MTQLRGNARSRLRDGSRMGRGHAVLFHKDYIARYTSRGHAPDAPDMYIPAMDWIQRDEFANPLGVVPVVPLINRRRVLNMDGESELQEIAPLADAINKLATDLMTASEFHSMPRRWVTGLEIVEDEAGMPVKPFSSSAGSLWQAESEDTKFGQFPEGELRGFIESIKSFKADFSSTGGAATALCRFECRPARERGCNQISGSKLSE